MVCLSPVGYGVLLTFRALALRRSRLLYICYLKSVFLKFTSFIEPWNSSHKTNNSTPS